MTTGFYRVSIVKRNNKEYYKYQIRNKLLKKEIIRKDIYVLKKAVEDYGLLWGITNIAQAEKNKSKYNLKDLQGRYGIQIE